MNIIKRLATFLQLIRVKQYTKNLLLFAPAFFGAKLFSISGFANLLLAFISFSLVASTLYIINDLRDLKDDKKHPEKNSRPLASGKVKKTVAQSLLLLLLFLGLLAGLPLGVEFLAFLTSYIILMLAYSWKLKQFAVVDVFIIALGFVIRILAGGVVSQVWVSHWLVITTFLLALFLALVKRKADLRLYTESNTEKPLHFSGYNKSFLDISIIISATVTVVTYLMYTFSPEIIEQFHSQYLYATGIFVLFGILRYLQLAFVYRQDNNPSDVLLKDRLLQLTLILWVITFAVIIY